jgi:hypothetical protein
LNYRPPSPAASSTTCVAYFAEKNAVKRDEIACRQMQALRQYQGPLEKPVRIPDIKEVFLQMRSPWLPLKTKPRSVVLERGPGGAS